MVTQTAVAPLFNFRGKPTGQMAVSDRTFRKILGVGGLAVVFLFIGWVLFLTYVGRFAPTTPDAVTGRTFPYNNHGKVVYMTLTQELLRYALPAASFLGAGLLGILDRRRKRNRSQWPPDHSSME